MNSARPSDQISRENQLKQNSKSKFYFFRSVSYYPLRVFVLLALPAYEQLFAAAKFIFR
ncbi:hypothetical protein CAMRE0001_2838 [Campylobacter rectus RM3267]|uniref:Uncharacterized protein n=1 Tax=Campylobacter rectus RM3267 TaxID=553218 RepID=B9D126_CAMRE|nr:hypothetical protein CAMRE0001_2838 [Campylobacter rectus RM3267]